MVRRRTEWQDVFVNQSLINGAQQETTLILGTGADAKGKTLVRHIIRLTGSGTSPVANSSDLQVVTFGIGVFSDEEISAGTFPDPAVSNEIPRSGWLWRDQFVVAEAADSTSPISMVQIDLRAQRKLMYGRSVLIAVSKNSAGTAFNVALDGIVRSLVMLD